MASDESSLNCTLEDGAMYKIVFDGKKFGTLHVSNNEVHFESGAFGIVKGDEKSHVKVTYGEFENSDKRGLAGTNNEFYGIKIELTKFHEFTFFANFIPGEKNLMQCSGELIEYLDEDAMRRMADEYEKSDEYTHFYKLQPDNQGKIVVITGATGYGKTTSAEILRKDHGYVLYEGDCYFMGFNPYPKMSPEGPSFWGTKHVKEQSTERKAAYKNLSTAFGKLMKEGEKSPIEMFSMYEMLCDDVLKEKKKIGGNWVIPSAIYQRDVRDLVRDKLGDQCIFVILEVPEETQLRRLAKRLLGTVGGEVSEEAIQDQMEEVRKKNFTKGFESCQEGEKRTIVIEVNDTMTPEKVVDVILDKMKSY